MPHVARAFRGHDACLDDVNFDQGCCSVFRLRLVLVEYVEAPLPY